MRFYKKNLSPTYTPAAFDGVESNNWETLEEAFLDGCISAKVESCLVDWVIDPASGRSFARLSILPFIFGCEIVNAPTDEALVSECVRRVVQFRRAQNRN